jgi:hypothetical protein
MRGLGRHVRGDGRRSVRAEEIPSAARDDDECDPGSQQHKIKTLPWCGGLDRPRPRLRRSANLE